MKWIKKWSYIVLLIGTGAVYLSCVDNWQVYAKPLAQVKNWCVEAGLGDLFVSAGEGGLADGSGSSNEAGSGNLPVEDDSGEESGKAADGSQESPENQTDTGNSSDDGNEPSGPDTGEPWTVGEEGDKIPGETEETPEPLGEEPSGEWEEEKEPGKEDASAENPGTKEPLYMTVEDDYFSDAVFIGDSRTVGMFEYGGLEETAAFYASTGLTVYKMFDSAIVSAPGQKKKITVEEALQQNSFAKIYLMIGINEMGTGTVESFLEAYSEAVAHLQELQPDAIIFLQGIIRVTSERSAQGDYINNEGIDARNEGIAQLADNEKIFYLDVNPLICDETGGMVPEYTFDGVHLKAKYIEIWKDYLKSHAIFP